jgi:hypothetical protein
MNHFATYKIYFSWLIENISGLENILCLAICQTLIIEETVSKKYYTPTQMVLKSAQLVKPRPGQAHSLALGWIYQ